MIKKQSFIRGTLTLVLTGLFVRVLSFILRLVMVKTVGEEAMGLYHLVLPTFFFIYTFTQFGLPVAVCQRVSKHLTNKDTLTIRRVFHTSLLIGLLLSLLTCFILYVVKDNLLKILFSDTRLSVVFKPLFLLIPLATLSSICKGFFQGLHNMKPQGIAQVIEQITRLTLLLFCMTAYKNAPVDVLAKQLLFHSVYGEAIALTYLALAYLSTKFAYGKKNTYYKTQKKIVPYILTIALPTTGIRLIHSLGHFLEPLIIHKHYILSGLSVREATRAYGVLTSHVFPTLYFSLFIIQAIATVTIPSVTAALEKKQTHIIHFRIHQSIRYACIVGVFSTVLFMTYAGTLLQFIYGSDEGSQIIELLAPFWFFTFLHLPLYAVLQALEQTTKTLLYSAIAFIVKMITLPYFMSQFGRDHGIVFSFSIVSVLTATLYYKSVVSLTGYRLSKMFLSKTIALFLSFFFLTTTVRRLLVFYDATVITEWITLVFLVIFYLILVIVFKFILSHEWLSLKSMQHDLDR